MPDLCLKVIRFIEREPMMAMAIMSAYLTLPKVGNNKSEDNRRCLPQHLSLYISLPQQPADSSADYLL